LEAEAGKRMGWVELGGMGRVYRVYVVGCTLYVPGSVSAIRFYIQPTTDTPNLLSAALITYNCFSLTFSPRGGLLK
jgi:hypothetical protein